MKFIRSFDYAWQGIRYCYKTQFNFRVHVTILLLVVIAGFCCKISSNEWLVIIFCAMLVLALELINTAIEHLCDLVTKEIHPIVKIVKDVSAAAVLLAAVGSAISGTIIFVPKMLSLLKL